MVDCKRRPKLEIQPSGFLLPSMGITGNWVARAFFYQILDCESDHGSRILSLLLNLVFYAEWIGGGEDFSNGENSQVDAWQGNGIGGEHQLHIAFSNPQAMQFHSDGFGILVEGEVS